MMFPILLNRMNYTGIHMIEFVAMFIGIVIVIKHRENLKRILNGTESKFKFKKSKEAKTDAEQ